MSNQDTAFARWRWTPRTGSSNVERAYGVEHYKPVAQWSKLKQSIASHALAFAIGIFGALLLAHWAAA